MPPKKNANKHAAADIVSKIEGRASILMVSVEESVIENETIRDRICFGVEALLQLIELSDKFRAMKEARKINPMIQTAKVEVCKASIINNIKPETAREVFNGLPPLVSG